MSFYEYMKKKFFTKKLHFSKTKKSKKKYFFFPTKKYGPEQKKFVKISLNLFLKKNLEFLIFFLKTRHFLIKINHK